MLRLAAAAGNPLFVLLYHRSDSHVLLRNLESRGRLEQEIVR